MAKRIGPEARIITLFTALPEESQRIVFDIIKGQTATPRKTATKKASKKSAPGVDGAKCVTCDEAEWDANHNPDSPDYHIFRTEIKQKAATA